MPDHKFGNADAKTCLKEKFELCLKTCNIYSLKAYSHQASASTLTLALKFKWVLNRSKIVNVSVNADCRCEHGLTGLENSNKTMAVVAR